MAYDSRAQYFYIYLGSTTLFGGFGVVATQYKAHPGFNDYLNYDIALISLDTPVNLTNTIGTIRLPQPGTSVESGTSLVVSGWGLTSQAATSPSSVLNYVGVTAISNQLCSLVYGTSTVINSTLCTIGETNEGTCSGDSGGPLVRYDEYGVATLEGIVSFGAAAGCDLGYPSGFARVSKLLDWIKENCKDLS
ncbi:hypothetical protein Trydic_g8310 [Trypoxylus dichotomus]